MSAELQQVTTAVVEFDKIAAGLAELKSRYAGIVFDVTIPNGMEAAKSARQALRKPRYEIEQIRKNAKAPILALGKKLDSEAARITAEIMTIEGPIDQQIKNEEERKERERQEKIEAEHKRVEDIQNHIYYIRGLPLKGSGKTSVHAMAVLAEAEAIEIGEEFSEFADEARNALTSALAALKGIVTERQAFEAEQERIRLEREELARLRAEQKKRDDAERARLAEEERIAKAARDEEFRKAREERARLDTEAKVIRDAEAAKQAEELRLQREEQDRIQREREAAWDAQQAELQRQQEEIKRQKEELEKAQEPIVLETSRPTDDEIIGLIASHWSVDEHIAIDWILTLDLSARKAA